MSALFPAARHFAKWIMVADWFRGGMCPYEQWFLLFIWPGPDEWVPTISDSLRITQTHSFPFPIPIHPYLFDKCGSIDYKPKHILYSALQKKGAARSLIRKRRFIGARTPAPTPASYGPHDGVFRSIADKGDGSSIDMFKGFDVDGTSQKKRARAFATYSIKVPLRP